MRRIIAFITLSAILLLASCSSNTNAQMKNGYYTAEASDFLHGWKEYVTIFVHDGDIISIEYNAKNPSGYIKSWDMDYMRLMNSTVGNYPNLYTRNYGLQLLDKQNPDDIDALAGATTSYNSFKKLANAAIECARTGNTKVAIVDTN